MCYWHSFAWDGFDIFGAGTFDRPWIGDPSLDAAKTKMVAAVEYLVKLEVPFSCLQGRSSNYSRRFPSFSRSSSRHGRGPRHTTICG